MKAVLILTACLPLLTGCLSVTVGGKNEPTMASEIRELRRLRRQGTISSAEFEQGKLAVLELHREPEDDLNSAMIALEQEPAPPVVR